MSALVLAAAPALAQEPAAAPADRTLIVSAVDDKNQPVAGLSTSDVALLRRGVAQDVVAFEADTRPLELVLLVDSSQPLGSHWRLSIVDAVAGFVRGLPAGTRLSLWTTGDRPTKVFEGQVDAAAVTRALNRVVPRGGNRLLDAIVEAGEAMANKEGDRTAMVAVTGLGIGFTGTDRRQVVDRAAAFGAVVHGLTFDEGRAPGSIESPEDVGGSDYEYVLGELAEKTGGSFDSTLSAMSVKDRLSRVGAALAATYRLTYRSAEAIPAKEIEITVARPGVKVLRPGRKG
jgi:hypothetical protein